MPASNIFTDSELKAALKRFERVAGLQRRRIRDTVEDEDEDLDLKAIRRDLIDSLVVVDIIDRVRVGAREQTGDR